MPSRPIVQGQGAKLGIGASQWLTGGVLVLTLPWIPSGQLAENRRRGLHWGMYASILAQEQSTTEITTQHNKYNVPI